MTTAMLGERKARAALVAALAALASAVTPGVATADVLVDEDVGDFPSSTSTWSVEPGLVQRRPAGLSLNFDDPHGLEVTGAGTATLDGGALTVDNARVNTLGFSNPPQTLEFRATFGADDTQHIGLGDDLNRPLWAIFSRGGLPTGLLARTRAAGESDVPTPIAGVDPLVPHVYRVVWDASSVTYYVDGDLEATHPVAVTDMMRPILSDSSDAGVITVDWLAQGTVSAPAEFRSRVHDIGHDRVSWDAVTMTPGDLAIETRTGNTATPDDGTWSSWAPTVGAGEIASPPGRYIQYSTTLTNDDPVLDRVEISYSIIPPTAVIDRVDTWDGDATVFFHTPDAGIDDFECSIDGAAFAWCSSPFVFRNLTTGTHTVKVRAHDELGNPPGAPDSKTFHVDATPPSARIDAANLTGSQATMSFSSPDADAQVFECSLDSGAFSACTSPAVFSDLAVGAHVLRVRARDVAGNTGASDAWGFSVKPPGSGTQAGEDDSAPVIKLASRRVRASKRGSVTVKVGCPAHETRCRLTLRAGSGPKKTATVAGGKTVKVPVKLTAATRRKLADRGRLSVKIRIVARDDAGNRRIREYKFTVLAPR